MNIKDLPECLNLATSRLFADATNLTVADETIGEVITRDTLICDECDMGHPRKRPL